MREINLESDRYKFLMHNHVLNRMFWDKRYVEGNVGWDMGSVSPPLKSYIDQLADRDLSILIPGCGNAYEAEYLLKMGFVNITLIDISTVLVSSLNQRFKNYSGIRILEGNFFDHSGNYDLILEQTFFCALDPGLRSDYADRMHALLNKGGKLAGVLFNRDFDLPGPPFGGNKIEYQLCFEKKFDFLVFEECRNSHEKRKNTELFFILRKKN